MSTQREELAQEIFIADNSNQSREASIKDWQTYTPGEFNYTHGIADRLLAAGYRKPRTITTLEELDVLPGESVIRDSDAMVFEVDCMMDLPSDKWWIATGMRERIGSKFISLPATVLYEPSPGGAA